MCRISAFYIVIILILSANAFGQEKYKAMMKHNDYNFYVVCKEADRYFETHNKNAKGSGWKEYQRWRYNNEYKYFPSGNRKNVDPYFVANAYQQGLGANLLAGKTSFPNGWNELGPNRVDSITEQYSAGLGRVEDHYVDPNNINTMYLGSRSGGFWKTLDGGATWQGGSTDFLMASGVNTIAVSPTNPDSILINVRNSNNDCSHGIYRSIDGGDTWTVSNFNPSTLGFGGLGNDWFVIYKVAYHPVIPSLIFIGTSKGIYRSDDNLQTWTNLIPTGDIVNIAFRPANDSIIYLYDDYYWSANKNYVLRSTDMGLSYSLSDEIIGNNGALGFLAVSPGCPNCLYFASSNGVWRSIDNGMSYAFLSNPPQSCFGFAVNDLDTSEMIYGYVDIEASSDGGRTFNQITWWSLGNTNHGSGSYFDKLNNSGHYVHADLHPAKCINGVFYIGTDGFFCKSDDNGATWEILSQGTAIRENYKLGVSQSNHFISISGSQDNGTSIKKQDRWIEFYGADGMEGIIHPLNDDWMIGSVQYGGRIRTKDGGKTLDGVSPSGQSGSGNAAWEAPLAFDPNNHMRIYHFTDSVFVSEDFGTTWNYRGIPSSISDNIKQAAIAENNTDIIVVSSGEKIDKSIDGGATFTSIKNNLPFASIQDIAFDPYDDDIIVVVYATYENDNSKVFITNDGGSNWTNITHNLAEMPIHSVVIDVSEASNIYLGAEIGVYTKAMGSTNWVLYNPDFPNTTVQELEIVYGSNTIKAATWGRGLWEYTLVGKNDHPSILTTSLTDKPADVTPKESVEQYVTSVISYDEILNNVYLEWSVNSPIFGNLINMTNTLDSTWVSETHLPNYPVGTKMYFRVIAVGANGDTSKTYKFMYTIHPFEYCTAIGASNTTADYIDFVSLNGMQNPSGKESYGDFTDTLITLYRGLEYTLQIDLAFHWDDDTTGAWIDFNKNAVFDASEFILMSELDSNHESFGTFTVPYNAILNDTLRMRVRSQYWNQSPLPCGEETGEVEDYSIIVEDCSTSSAINPSVCDTYTSPSGNYVWATNGTYTDTILNVAGCDSIISINLTITPTNVGVTNNNPSLTANATGANYQWLDCDNNFASILGETGQTYTATENGNYAVSVTQNGCTDTSACYTITILKILENTFQELPGLYPNPTSGALSLEMGREYDNITINISNIGGKVISSKSYKSITSIQFEIKETPGIYMVEVISQEGELVKFQVVKY